MEFEGGVKMPLYRKKSGKHHYRGADGEIHVIKAGDTIECEPSFLGAAISTFEKVPTMVKKKKKKDKEKEKKDKKDKKPFVRPDQQVLVNVKLIRILGKDIPGNKKVYHGLTFIKGISWSFSNAICKSLKLDKNKTIEQLSEEEIKRISEFIL